MSRIPRTVLVLGLASLLTDLSAEMIYPLLPLFLSSVLGASALQLGLIEGVAEATASLLKVVSGAWADRSVRRKPLIVAGYGISGLFRPLIGIAASWHAVLGFRFLDRVGKGIRTSPRDALIADVTQENHRGAAYGLHRAMDHAGAVVGPLIATALLLIPGMTLRQVFLLAAIPAIATIAVLVFGVKEDAVQRVTEAKGPVPRLGGWSLLGRDFHGLLLAVGIFTLGNATDAFLLVRLSESGIPAAWIALLWALHNAVKMTSTYFGGRLSDRIGTARALLLGWILYSVTYLAFALVTDRTALVAVFLAYGLYYGLAEPAERSLIAALAPAKARGRAFGYFHFVVGIGALPASLLFGYLWTIWGAPTAFVTGAALAAAASLILLFNRGSPATWLSARPRGSSG